MAGAPSRHGDGRAVGGAVGGRAVPAADRGGRRDGTQRRHAGTLRRRSRRQSRRRRRRRCGHRRRRRRDPRDHRGREACVPGRRQRHGVREPKLPVHHVAGAEGASVRRERALRGRDRVFLRRPDVEAGAGHRGFLDGRESGPLRPAPVRPLRGVRQNRRRPPPAGGRLHTRHPSGPVLRHGPQLQGDHRAGPPPRQAGRVLRRGDPERRGAPRHRGRVRPCGRGAGRPRARDICRRPRRGEGSPGDAGERRPDGRRAARPRGVPHGGAAGLRRPRRPRRDGRPLPFPHGRPPGRRRRSRRRLRPGRRHRLHQHQPRPGWEGRLARRLPVPEDGGRPGARGSRGPGRHPSAVRGGAVRLRGRHRLRAGAPGPHDGGRRRPRRDNRAGEGGRPARPRRGHRVRDRRPGLQVHSLAGRGGRRLSDEQDMRRRDRLVRGGAGGAHGDPHRRVRPAGADLAVPRGPGGAVHGLHRDRHGVRRRLRGEPGGPRRRAVQFHRAQLPAQSGGRQARGKAHRPAGRRGLQPRHRGGVPSRLRRPADRLPLLPRERGVRRRPARDGEAGGPGRRARHRDRRGRGRARRGGRGQRGRAQRLQRLRLPGRRLPPREGERVRPPQHGVLPKRGKAAPRELRRRPRPGQEDRGGPLRAADPQVLSHGERLLQIPRLQRAAERPHRRGDRPPVAGDGAGGDLLSREAGIRAHGATGRKRRGLHLPALRPHPETRDVPRGEQLRLRLHADRAQVRRAGASPRGEGDRSAQPRVRPGLWEGGHGGGHAVRGGRAGRFETPVRRGAARRRDGGARAHEKGRGTGTEAALLAETLGQGAGPHHPQLRRLRPGPEHGHPAALAGTGAQGRHPFPPARPRPRHIRVLPQSLLALWPAHPLRREDGGAPPQPLRRVPHQPRVRPGQHALPHGAPGNGRQTVPSYRGGRAFLRSGRCDARRSLPQQSLPPPRAAAARRVRREGRPPARGGDRRAPRRRPAALPARPRALHPPPQNVSGNGAPCPGI